MRTAVFSIISPNYRPHARVLMGSLLRHEPEWDRYVLVVGERDTIVQDEPSFAMVPLEALPLPSPRLLAFRYTILELNTAVKPWMFEHLFSRGYDRVIYLDPDILVCSPLIELDHVEAGTFLVLTPHLTGSIPGTEHPSERTILQAGVYNLGFLAAFRHPDLERFLAWWQEKLEFQCVIDVARGIFVDQKWMDLAPGLFSDVAILRHDGYNVAYWNLRQRTVVRSGDEFRVNGQPLRFFHFSGLNPAHPAMVSRHDSELTIAGIGDAGPLITDYLARLERAGFTTFLDAPYAFESFTDGTSIPDAARRAYRNSRKLQAAAGSDPFQKAALFVGVRDAPRHSPFVARARLMSYRMLSSARPLVRLFPKPLRTRMRELFLGRSETTPALRARESALPPGLNVLGYFGQETGVGESARLCLRACRAVELPSAPIDIDRRPGPATSAIHRASIFHANADQLGAVLDRLGRVAEASAYTIGCWHWELPEFPDAWVHAAGELDEIWATSTFVQRAISRKVTIPVVHMPHGIAVTDLDPCSPAEFGVEPGRFTFLCMFDFDSVLERKNPMGAIEAFQRAFSDSDPVSLLIKVSHAARHRRQYTELQERVREVPGVHLADAVLTRERVNGLLAACDGVLSLHRSEGFGLILAEAMYLGKPVVATGWSGNMDFMNGGNSCPVQYELRALARNIEDYQAGQQWAEPDLEHAAHLMRRLVENDAFRRRIGQRACETIHSQFSLAAAGRRYLQRLTLLGLMKGHAVS
jgi:glycosyltransferase involved in cell wall biosynthesis